MKKRYQLVGELPFRVEPPYSPWIDPSGGGYFEADIEPGRERFLIAAGLIKEAPRPDVETLPRERKAQP